MNTSTPIIEARDLTVGYGSYVVQKDLCLLYTSDAADE